MTIKEYQQLAQRTSPDDGHDRALNGKMGLIGEAGEVVDVVKKWAFQSTKDTPLPREKLVEEIGDVLWYAAEFCAGNGVELDEFLKPDDVPYRPKTPLLIGYVLDIAYYATQMSSVPADMAYYPMTVLFKACERVLAVYCNTTMSDAMERNIAKLRKRYPDGFDAERSMHRE